MSPKVSSWLKPVLQLSFVSGNAWATPKLALSSITKTYPLALLARHACRGRLRRGIKDKLMLGKEDTEVPVELQMELVQLGIVVSCFTGGIPIPPFEEVFELMQQSVAGVVPFGYSSYAVLYGV